ncbi:MAG TPA: hypothetical protein DCZ95_20130 [Verrucomicrobia bacterium]|nr:MAG: hypothetical protein A2X46_02975 [Lentisphaerae bacterium GWF2_57_35]HBA86395.1 hypothetical protein [Verrucomicrobiota bacterium]
MKRRSGLDSSLSADDRRRPHPFGVIRFYECKSERLPDMALGVRMVQKSGQSTNKRWPLHDKRTEWIERLLRELKRGGE